jgi:hypothetical protein
MANDNDGLYDVTVTTFDDVTEFRSPESIEREQGNYLRLYDAEANTLVYTTTEDTDDGSVVMALRDATDYAASE